jgi:transcriptional regulator with XRE-family HTH domain
MSINDKIKQILLNKGYSPSHFADEIGVQRSSISHILSGRNRPSFDIIQKIIKRFPDLGFDWILEEDAPSQSSFNRSSSVAPAVRRQDSFINEGVESISRSSPHFNNRLNRSEISASRDVEYSPEHVDRHNTVVSSDPKKRVERILIFYNDGTFQEYNPS